MFRVTKFAALLPLIAGCYLSHAAEVESDPPPLLSASQMHSCARNAAGVLACWGANGYGVLGDGTTTDRLSATPVVDLADSVEISAGLDHTRAPQLRWCRLLGK
jgi:hypothetical protein